MPTDDNSFFTDDAKQTIRLTFQAVGILSFLLVIYYISKDYIIYLVAILGSLVITIGAIVIILGFIVLFFEGMFLTLFIIPLTAFYDFRFRIQLRKFDKAREIGNLLWGNDNFSLNGHFSSNYPLHDNLKKKKALPLRTYKKLKLTMAETKIESYIAEIHKGIIECHRDLADLEPDVFMDKKALINYCLTILLSGSPTTEHSKTIATNILKKYQVKH